jgi:hypothetical protein
MQIKNQKDFFSGLMFMGIGGSFAWRATTYNVGSAANIGPGYFPLLLGLLLALLGMLLTFKSLVTETEDGGRLGRWAWRPMVCILVAHGVFGLLLAGWPAIGLRPMGFVVAVFVLVFLAALAAPGCGLRQAVVLALASALGSYLVCFVLLRLPIAVWPASMVG